MDRAGKSITPLGIDELQDIYEVLSSGGSPAMALKRVPRSRNTVYRAFNVLAQFRARGLVRLDDDTITIVADAAMYDASKAYVRKLFLTFYKPFVLDTEEPLQPVAAESPRRGMGNSAVATKRRFTI